MEKEAMKKVKGIPYEIVGENVVIHKEDGDVTLPLVLGKSAYATVFSFLNRKGGSRGRASGGVSKLGNFTFKVEEDTLTIFHKNGEVLGSKELVEDNEKRYPRTVATNMILSHFE